MSKKDKSLSDSFARGMIGKLFDKQNAVEKAFAATLPQQIKAELDKGRIENIRSNQEVGELVVKSIRDDAANNAPAIAAVDNYRNSLLTNLTKLAEQGIE